MILCRIPSDLWPRSAEGEPGGLGPPASTAAPNGPPEGPKRGEDLAAFHGPTMESLRTGDWTERGRKSGRKQSSPVCSLCWCKKYILAQTESSRKGS